VQKGPYLQHLSSSAVDIEVELSVPSAVTVDVSADARSDAKVPATFSSRSAAFQSVHVTGLRPATHYRYAVHVDRAAPLQGTFVTAPDDASHAPFTFAIYGDNRTGGPAHERIVHALLGERFDFLVHTGDFVIQGADEGAWKSFFDIEEPLLRDHCVFACVGNHELFNDREAAHFERYFGPVAPTVPDAPPPPIYGTFRWGRARFFLLNAFTEWDRGPERAWLDAALASADHEAGIDLRVAVIHHGPYSSGPHGNNQRFLDAHIDRLLVDHHVDLVVAGHDHIYERGEASGLKYLVSGGGGAPLYRDITPIPSTRKVEATYNYVLATVTDAGVAILAKRPDGSVIEQCSFARAGSWQCDPVKAPEARPAPPPLSVKASSKGDRCACDVVGRPASRGLFAVLAGLAVACALARRRARRRA
jgi:predicted phosphodiesterase